MKAITVVEQYYPELLEKLKEKFPFFVETMKEVEVIPWSKEYEVFDRNPEVIEDIEFWNTLLDNDLISKEEWEKQVSKHRGYASKTMGIAFRDRKEVSFRTPVPDRYVFVHEVGHIHFDVTDTFWSASYAGAEVLLWLALEKDMPITERGIRRFIELMKRAYSDNEYEAVAGEIVEALAPLWNDDIVPAFYPICLATGWMPEGAYKAEESLFDLKSSRWLEIPIEKRDVFSFFQNLTEGLRFYDPFWIRYAEELGIKEK